ncbi:MAG: hypothetical protein E6G14_11140 [Actinobacteria bacterium]|nr:MAG: hypothetical protein E6G14_11140 [Actinomycetota bacterium]
MAAKSRGRKLGETARPSTRTRPGAAVLKRKSCFLCKHHVNDVDYKNVDLLRRYLSERGNAPSVRRPERCPAFARPAVRAARPLVIQGSGLVLTRLFGL